MSLVSQQQLMQNQLQLKQLENQRNKQVQQSKSLVSSISTSGTNTASVAKTSTKDSVVGSSNNIASQQSSKEVELRKKIKSIPPHVYSDPLAITIPTKANPTDILAARFNSWRIIISALSHYLKETVSVNEEITRQQIRLHHAISFPFLTQGLDGEFYQPLRVSNQSQNQNSNISSSLFHSSKDNDNDSDLNSINPNDKANEFDLARKLFLPLGAGSIQDLPTILYQYHSNAALLAQSTVKELNSTIVPRLEDLKRDLLIKIKEIKSLQSDFKNQVDRYQSETSRLLSTYIRSIDSAKIDSSQLDPKNDPYLIKFALDRSIRRQLTEENYLHEAFINIQTSGKELEKVVYIELQTALTVYAKLLGQQAQNVFDTLISKLDSTILTKEPAIEWDAFIDRYQDNFIELNLPMRRSSEIRYKYQNEPLTYEIKSGWLERKSKFLKSYQRSWYVLTSCFLHEFKSSDRRKDPIPERSLLLSELSVSEHSRKDEKNPNSYHKFVIMHGQSTGLLHKRHNWVFRAESYDLMMSWYNDIKRVSQLSGPVARSAIASEKKHNNRRTLNANNNGSSNANGNESTATSIMTKNRNRGVSLSTTQTNKTETGTENNFTPVVETSASKKDVKPTPTSTSLEQVKSTNLTHQNTGISSLSMGLMDHSDVIVVPIKHDSFNDSKSPQEGLPNHIHGKISQITPSTLADNDIVESNMPANNNPSSLKQQHLVSNGQQQSTLAEQQQLILQQQALLEQKQRQLLEEQRELQQRAFSLTSSVQQQFPQQQFQSSQPVPSMSLTSDISNKIEGMKPISSTVEELSEKVGELGVDESH